MQKIMIFISLTSCLAIPMQAMASNSNITFYGKADVSYDSINTGDGTTTANGTTAVSGTTKRVVSSNVSRFGFKGGQKLGNGLSAIWKVEQQIDIDASAKNTFASRNTFLGLKGKFGTVLLGRHDTPYKIATRKLDVFRDGIADNRALLGGVKGTSSKIAFDSRPTNELLYFTPDFGGLTAALSMANLTEGNTKGSEANDSLMSVAVMYKSSHIQAALGYESHNFESNVTTTEGTHETAAKLGLGYTLDDLSVGVVYEKISDDLGANKEGKYDHTATYVSGKYTIGNSAVKLAYGKSSEIGAGVLRQANSDASQISVGYDHGLDKNTKVYILYTRLADGNGIDYGFSQSTAASSSNSGFGTSPSAISLGMQHAF